MRTKVQPTRGRSRGSVGVVLALVLVSTAACSSLDDEGPADGDPTTGAAGTGGASTDGGATGGDSGNTSQLPTDLILDVATEPDTLDPILRSNFTTGRISQLTHQYLLGWDEEGNLVPDLAELPEVTDGGLTYTFTIRPGYKFADGTTVDAQDVVFTYEAITNPDNGSGMASTFNVVDSVEAPDDSTVIMRLNQENYYLGDRLTGVPIISDETEYVPNETYADSHNGSGPYTVTAFNRGQSIVLERNENYQGDPFPFDSITYTLVPEPTSRLTRLVNGETHIVPDVPLEHMTIAQERGHNAATVEGKYNASFLYASHKEGRPTSDVKFREAIAWAINRQQIIDAVHGGAGVPNSTYLAPSSNFVDPALNGYFGAEPDIAKAQAALQEAGGAPAQPITIITTNDQGRVPMATIIQANLKEIGINASIEVSDVAGFSDRLIAGDFDLVLWGGDRSFSPEYIVGGLLSDSANNFTGYGDEEMDELLLGAIATDPSDRGAAEAAWRAVQQRDIDTLPTIQVVAGGYNEAWSSALSGYQPSKLNYLNTIQALAGN